MVLERRLLYVGNSVETEAAHAFIEPEPCNVVQFLPQGAAFPVEVGLEFAKSVKVVLLPRQTMSYLALLRCAISHLTSNRLALRPCQGLLQLR